MQATKDEPPRWKVAAVVIFYMAIALIMVMINKWVLITNSLPLTFLFLQLSLATLCVRLLSMLPTSSPFSFRLSPWTRSTLLALAPVCTAHVVGLISNIYCLQLVDASYFQVARGLTLPMTVALHAITFREMPTTATLLSCGLVTWGFTYSFIPVPLLPASAPVVPGGRGQEAPILGMILGILSAVLVAIHTVLVKAALEHVEGRVLVLAYWQNALSTVALIPAILASGEVRGLERLLDGTEGELGAFVTGSIITGIVGFLICVAGVLSIKVTSPVTHMFSAAARSVLQMILGVHFFGDVINASRLMSMLLILTGSISYTYYRSKLQFQRSPVIPSCPSPSPSSTADNGPGPTLEKEKELLFAREERDVEKNLNERKGSKLEELATGADGCYVIYTSGTTGRPKGVDVRHSGVSNFLLQSPGNVGMRPGMRVAQLLNIAFDFGAWELLGALSNGCTLCLRGLKSAQWRSVLQTVDVVLATPSILSRDHPADYPTIKHVMAGGEPCPQNLADCWSRYTNFYNCCGPTEISIVNTVQPHVTGQRVSIGRPVPNTTVYVLDEALRPCRVGKKGTMWVGGAGASRGYLTLPETTAERYRLDPFLDNGGMMFNTGDLGRFREEGQLDHLGRKDDLVKIKGFRVELDGESAAMMTCPEVDLAVALMVRSELWGFVTPETASQEAIRDATARLYPYYAVPTRYLPLRVFPQTRNGKVDKGP